MQLSYEVKKINCKFEILSLNFNAN